ncbi:DcaP family trimeric outer membrane transporter [Alteriqipengyuania sp. 357]
MKTISKRRVALLCGVASLGTCLTATPAMAQTSDVEALEARLKTLEAGMAELRAQLAAARSASEADGAASDPAHAAPAQRADPAAPPAKTSVELSGFFKTHVSLSRLSDGALASTSAGNDFYIPATIPVSGGDDSTSFRGDAKQTRIVVKANTPVAGHRLAGLLEVDFQSSPGVGTQRLTNAYNPALRRAFITFDNLLIGQEWTNFQYLPALPETTDYLGPSEGTVFARQAQVRYTAPLSQALTLSLALENPSATVAIADSAAIVEHDTDRMPDLTGRLNFALGGAEFSLAGLAREVSIEAGNDTQSAFGWGVSLAGKIALDQDRRHDLRFMVTRGEGIGRYVGLNLSPDAILLPGSTELETFPVTAGFAAVKFGWTDRLRSTLMASAQRIDYPDGPVFAGLNEQAWSASVNLFYSPVKQFDVGIELRHGERELVSGERGQLDRIEFAAKYGF